MTPSYRRPLTGASSPASVVLALLLAAPGLAAQDLGGAEADTQAAPFVRAPGFNAQGDYLHADAPTATAVPVRGPIQIDGRLDEDSWAAAPPITDFRQEVPDEGQPASQPTEFRIVFDDDAIYVGALLRDDGELTSKLIRRDVGRGDFDYVTVSLDSFHDHETVYQFNVNPSGAIRDAVTGQGGPGGDTSWDPVWESDTEVFDGGWSMEMRIPFSQLRFKPDEEQVWGIYLARAIHRNQERTSFPFVPTLETGGPSRFAHLEGIRSIEPGRRLELLPYVAARAEYVELADPAGISFSNPYRTGSDHFAQVGADLKYRLTSNVTLDATVNPDFGQVELDPSVINLSAFETRYEERRPFFVEGADIFNFGEGGPQGSTGRGPQLLYSRRIGRAPQGPVPSEAVFSDVAETTTILGAAKVTGRTSDGWSLGLLEAVTGEESSQYVDAAQVGHEAVVEPMTNYFVGRLRRQIHGGDTRFGVIASLVNRRLSDSGLGSRLHAGAYSGGADFAHEWSNRTYRIAGLFTMSRVQGDPAAILRTQRSSTRYYQRPDANHLDLDPTATSLSGYYGMVDLAKTAGAFGAKFAFAAASPGYEVNDLGFQTASDRLIVDTNFSYQQPDPGDHLRRWDLRGSPDVIWNYGGDRVFTEVNGNFSLQLLNYWGGGVRLAYNPVFDDDRLTRGGPMATTPERFSVNLNLNSDTRRTTVVRGGYQWAGDEAGGWQSGGNLNVTASPSEMVELQLGPRLVRRHESAQFVTSVGDPLAADTFGRRYVFGGLDQTTVSLDTRVSVTFTPTLSLQLYAEPFISSGDYHDLKEFARPGTFSFLEYGTDTGTIQEGSGGYRIDPDGAGPAEAFTAPDRDFSYRSLLGNAVLRWEWRPGSTLYLVWQQRRIDSLGGGTTGASDGWIGDFDFRRDAGDMFEAHPDNIFVVKVNYWLNP